MKGNRSLAGKVAIITGAGSGIGEATARLFATEGAAVVIADRDAEQGKRVEQEIKQLGGDALSIQMDVTSLEDCKRLVDETLRRYERVDVLHSNAGTGVQGPTHLIEYADWDRTIATDLTATFWLSKLIIPSMLERKKGSVIVTSSCTAILPYAGQAPYAVAKAGLNQFVRCLALEYAKDGIRFNSICPGPIETSIMTPERSQSYANLVPMGRVGQPSEVAELALFLASDDSSYVSGAVITIDGAWSTGLKLG